VHTKTGWKSKSAASMWIRNSLPENVETAGIFLAMSNFPC